MSIRASLIEKTQSERIITKSDEVVSVLSTGVYRRDKYDIEITAVEKIVGGVSVFVRAWDKEGTQYGFGSGGDVDIERMRVFNPPILVPDNNGDYKRNVEVGGQIITLSYREDAQEAILQVIEDNIRLLGKLGSIVTTGKVGRTTSTFYPSAGSSAPVDGYARKDTAAGGVSWATIQGAATGDGADHTWANLRISLRGGTTSNQWRELARSIMGFDTSSIPDSDTISSATLSLYDSIASSNPSTFSLSVVIDRTVPASSTAITTSDYDVSAWDVVEQASNRVAFTSFTASAAYKDFTLNATGIGNINKTGETWFGARSSADFDNSTPTWANNVESDVTPPSADATGTSTDPKLVVEHAAGATYQPRPVAAGYPLMY